MDNTLLNPNLPHKPEATLVNAELSADTALLPGGVVNGRYQILRQVHSAGEADLFLCTDVECQEERILKMYRRAAAVKEEVYQALSSLVSPSVARIFDAGTWGGRDYEVVEYFTGGSLAGRKFTAEELRESIIPQLVEGLHALHQCALLHKDVKPSNIMLRSAETLDLALIDFGISSMLDEGNTVLVEQSGFTPVYAAPETFHGLYLEASDYYSLGMTICALFEGRPPYEGLENEQVARMIALQRVPLPSDIPPDLADLIMGLTYPNLTNRNDETNHDKRWSYPEVLRWLHNEKVPVPGRQISFLTDFCFRGDHFDNLSDLTEALIEHWEDGKAALSSGALADAFRASLPGIAPLCAQAQADAQTAGREDIAYMHFLYKLTDNTVCFFWQGRRFDNTTALGTAMLVDLQQGKQIRFCRSLLEEHALFEYVRINHLEDTPQATAIRAIEDAWAASKSDQALQMRLYYSMAYLLSGLRKLIIGNEEFYTIGELQLYLQKLANQGIEELRAGVNHLITPDVTLVPQFEAWLISQEYGNSVEQWKHLIHPI